MDFKTFINGVGNDLKTSIDDVIGAIITIQEDVASLKTKTSKPDKDTAKALLEYIGMDEGKTKQNLEALCGKELQKHLKWLSDYCFKYNCTQEEALQRIIDRN
ncbi:MAG: hypothetical protein UR30_C0005G0110 [Candidatus Peregrinibacteria bacterium GW2011_GWC2_33_13]|nr:MAG: hypothetical protein UR30_C0005G0110 [Candidatus Peregrinibacteria bacterium GW2011_GWC2_33_13]